MDGIAESRIAIELSTAGLRKPVGEIYPDPTFLRWCLEPAARWRCPATPTCPTHLGHGYDEALELLDGLGVSEIGVFERRARRLEPMDGRR